MPHWCNLSSELGILSLDLDNLSLLLYVVHISNWNDYISSSVLHTHQVNAAKKKHKYADTCCLTAIPFPPFQIIGWHYYKLIQIKFKTVLILSPRNNLFKPENSTAFPVLAKKYYWPNIYAHSDRILETAAIGTDP